MKPSRVWTTVALAALLAACSARPQADPAGPGRNFDESYVGRIQRNVTTKDDVLRNLGEPASRSTIEGAEVWVYRYEQQVGQGADAKVVRASKKNLTIVFTGDVVQTYTYDG